MRASLTVLTAVLSLAAAPAAAAERLAHLGEARAKPRAIAAFALAAHRIEMTATTRRARADTPLARAYSDDCAAMAKVLPGYPQPASVSLGLRLSF